MSDRGIIDEVLVGRRCSLPCRELLETVLERIDHDPVQRDLCFLILDCETAREHADALDRWRRGGPIWPHNLAGLPVSTKDLFDVQGQVTKAGSIVLSHRSPATSDAGAVARLRQAGMNLLGRTNMTEFAYSGLGLNPHFGTPGNAYDAHHIPGGSSSGSGVAVAQGFSVISLASDTSGSVRIPAAFNGVVGLKPSCHRYPRDGMVPLSSTQDCVGVIAPTVQLCAAVDSVLATQQVHSSISPRVGPIRFVIPRGYLLEDLDHPTSQAFERALTLLSSVGFQLDEADIPGLHLAKEIGLGGILGPEAYAWHESLIAASGAEYDPRVRARLEAASSSPRERYLEYLVARLSAKSQIDRTLFQWDALLCPTTPSIAPRFDEIVDDATYFAMNARVMRNTFAFNILDLPALSLPCQARGAFPVGLMLVGARGSDRRLLSIAQRVETILSVR